MISHTQTGRRVDTRMLKWSPGQG